MVRESRTKRIGSAVGAMALVLSLAACGSNRNPAAGTGAGDPGAREDGSLGSQTTTLPGGPWRLVALQRAGEAAQGVPAGTTFSATFRGDGSMNAVADCNRCGAHYTSDARAMSVGPLACTRAYCTRSAPFDSQFESVLSTAARWKVQDGVLEVGSDAGVLTFER